MIGRSGEEWRACRERDGEVGDIRIDADGCREIGDKAMRECLSPAENGILVVLRSPLHA